MKTSLPEITPLKFVHYVKVLFG